MCRVRGEGGGGDQEEAGTREVGHAPDGGRRPKMEWMAEVRAVSATRQLRETRKRNSSRRDTTVVRLRPQPAKKRHL